MPEFHAEPYVYLPAVTHKSALVAWGALRARIPVGERWDWSAKDKTLVQAGNSYDNRK